ncbi:hypothetical protein SAMN02927900_03315 [Rhizobium mongolense subsp. loessense]|uniref:Uncharacterized protein n=1 Tax=Rhizobium mongolense subsp. loessense TaxID=158890 RepID=A0A1G4S1Y5_9HYPH|nr:hypothetical protein SAMN02927900_03315 [Rhizobium mongolense subsp. loessense]
MHDLNGLAGHAVINVQTATQIASSVKSRRFLQTKPPVMTADQHVSQAFISMQVIVVVA